MSTTSDSKKHCKCGKLRVMRANLKTQEKFYGCSNYPACKLTEPFKESTKVRNIRIASDQDAIYTPRGNRGSKFKIAKAFKNFN